MDATVTPLAFFTEPGRIGRLSERAARGRIDVRGPFLRRRRQSGAG
jgi:hypothetical protein